MRRIPRPRPPGEWYTPVIVGGEVFHTGTWHEFERLGLSDVAIARLPSPLHDELTTAMYRQSPNRPFDDDDLTLLSLIYPLWVGALGTRSALQAIRPDVADPLAEPLVAASARIRYPRGDVQWSKRARELFTMRLGPISARGWKRLERALHHAVRRFYGASVRGRSQPFLDDIRVELAHEPPTEGAGRALIALFIEDKEARADVHDEEAKTPAEELLSPRQRVVARLAARGETIVGIAAAMELAPETVRDYLKVTYQRLAVSTRAELAQLVG